ncbi:MAG: mechanosensitive ion channel family protein [Opitutales bacterium]|nr:mechanosensitive ion channel family protein [Opitutales bacterium]
MKKIAKFAKYALAALAISAQAAAFSYAEEKNQNPADAQLEEFVSEAAHMKLQQEFDRKAIEMAMEKRKRLKGLMDKLRDKYPATVDALETKVLGVRIIQYIAAFIVLFATFIIVKYIFGILFSKLIKFSGNRGSKTFTKVFIFKIRNLVNVMAWTIGIYSALEFVVRYREAMPVIRRAGGIVFLCAMFWLISILLDSIFSVAATKLKNKSAANLIAFINRLLKILLIIIAALTVMTHCGLNVSALIASLGIGGVALAFAAQDTIANFFGSVSIILDRPFIVGDWIKSSSCEGNVEAIGFRSTRVRTFDKTLVTIPNSTLAKENIENFSMMPARRVVQKLGFTYDSAPETIEAFLPQLCDTVSKIEGVAAEQGVRAEFTDFADSSLDITLIYYTQKIDYGFFASTKKSVNLEIMKLARKNGLSFAFPSTSLYIEKK